MSPRAVGQVAPQRFVPFRGRPLTVGHIRGKWRPSGAVAGAGVFAVLWEAGGTTYWAPLHDFCVEDQLRLIAACKQLDQGPADVPAKPEGGL